MLNVLSDVLATLFPSQLEIPRKELPSIDKTSVIYELKHHLVILAQMAAASASPNTGGTTASDSVNHITKTLLPNWVQRGIFTAEDGTSLEAKIRSHAAKDVSQIAAELRLDQEIDTISSSILFSDTLTLDKILPKRHHLPDHPNASWDTLPAMNGLFLRRIRGFPLRAGALQNGLTLQNAGSYRSSQCLVCDRCRFLSSLSSIPHDVPIVLTFLLFQGKSPLPKQITTSQQPTPPPSASRAVSPLPRKLPTSTASGTSSTPNHKPNLIPTTPTSTPQTNPPPSPRLAP
jgi:hypothetical protein